VANPKSPPAAQPAVRPAPPRPKKKPAFDPNSL
jgi:hypothetical protein